MKGELNPELNVGDEIVLYFMEGETSIPMGTKGIVKRITADPFESENDGKLIEVEWENGSQLSLVSTTDAWKKTSEKNKLNEDSSWNFITSNPDVFENFDWKFFRDYLTDVRDSGIVNMYGASPLIYAGREHINRYYGEGREDNEEFQKVLDSAEESKNKLIQGVLKYMDKNDKDIENIDLINRYARHFSQKLLGVYMIFINFNANN